MTSLPASDPGCAAVWGSKRINPRPQSYLCLTWSGCPSNDDDNDEMLAVMLLSQHLVSSSKTVRPRALCGAQCIGHAIRMWPVVFSEALHSQFSEEVRFYLSIDKWSCPTPVCRQLHNPGCLGQTHFNRLGTGCGYENTEFGSILAVLHFPFMICPSRNADAKFCKFI